MYWNNVYIRTGVIENLPNDASHIEWNALVLQFDGREKHHQIERELWDV